jgi:hypothetical protein
MLARNKLQERKGFASSVVAIMCHHYGGYIVKLHAFLVALMILGCSTGAAFAQDSDASAPAQTESTTTSTETTTTQEKKEDGDTKSTEKKTTK